MAFRTWGTAVLSALGVGALVGAGQIGVAYGLGILHFARSFDAGGENQWNAQLAWVGWFAMVAAVAGAAFAARLARRQGYAPGAGTRIALALSGGVGAAAVVPLSMRPARAADLTQTVDPALVVGLAAGLGAVAGVLVAVAALSLRPLAWNVTTVSAVVWVAALVSVVPHLGESPDVPLAIRLGVPQWTVPRLDTDRLVDIVGMPVLALLAGALVAAVARGRRATTLGAAVNGVAGAALLALAYLISGPGVDNGTTDQMAPYLGSLIAVPAGLFGSLLVTVLVRRDRPAKEVPDRAAAADRVAAPPRADEPLEPTNIIPRVTPPQRAKGSARVPGRVNGRDSVPPTEPLPRRNPGESLPRRTPRQPSQSMGG